MVSSLDARTRLWQWWRSRTPPSSGSPHSLGARPGRTYSSFQNYTLCSQRVKEGPLSVLTNEIKSFYLWEKTRLDSRHRRQKNTRNDKKENLGKFVRQKNRFGQSPEIGMTRKNTTTVVVGKILGTPHPPLGQKILVSALRASMKYKKWTAFVQRCMEYLVTTKWDLT